MPVSTRFRLRSVALATGLCISATARAAPAAMPLAEYIIAICSAAFRSLRRKRRRPAENVTAIT